MENINDLSLEKKINLYVIYLPTFNNYLDGKYINKDYEYIQNTLRRLNIEYLDINKEIFTLEKNPKIYFLSDFMDIIIIMAQTKFLRPFSNLS